MVGKGNLGVMYGNEALGVELADLLAKFFGHGVDIAPVDIVLAILHDGKVYVWELFTEPLESHTITAISRVKDLALRCLDEP